MRALVDTHTLLWWATGDGRIPQRVLDLLENAESELVVSIASVWEMALKIHRIGLTDDLETLMERATNSLGITILPIELRHCVMSARLPFHHRDPFDRMLIAQAMADDVPIITADAAIRQYPVRVIW